MRGALGVLLAVLVAAPAFAQAPSSTPPSVDPRAFPTLGAMLSTLQNGSDASKYCAQTGGLYLEADGRLRENMTEAATVEAIVDGGKANLGATERKRVREIATAVTSLAAGFRQLAPESSAIAYAQTCLASTRAAPGTRNQQEITDRYTQALACDRKFKPGSLEGKECVAKAFAYR